MNSSGNTTDFLSGLDWKRILGERLAGLDQIELQQLELAICRHSRRSIRLNPHIRDSELPFAVETVPWYDLGRWIADPSIRPGAYLHYPAGDYYIQDSASLLALNVCRIQPDEAICDVCAAPGGKSTGILQQLKSTGYLVSNEVIRSRLQVLHHAIERTGFGNYAITSLDISRLAAALPGVFDCVLVDAPCSGQSLLSSNRQSLSAFSQHQIEHSAARQQRILQSASQLAKLGGRMVYSTCTFSVAENEWVIEQFLDQNAGWQPIQYADLKEWESPLLTGCYRLWPHRDGCDGAFVAALIRTSDSDESSLEYCTDSSIQETTSTTQVRHPSSKRIIPWRGKLTQIEYLDCEELALEDYTLWQVDDRIVMMKNQIPTELTECIVSTPSIGRLRNGRVEPEYASAVLHGPLLKPKSIVELSSTQAVRYLSGESIQWDASGNSLGWSRVDWLGRQLAWGKLSDGRLKNHLPKSLRRSNLILG